ncbi:MAG: 4-alpha-glucanotransferase, partial [Mycobacteriales bacterium]
MDTALDELAAAHGVATWYRDSQRRRVDVDPDVVRRVLGLLGVSADTPAQVADALAAARTPRLPGTTMVVTPPALPEPPRTWGWMLQLYALRSAGSWGIGDLADLREFISWTVTAHGSGAVLVNQLHAVTPTSPVQPSPYSPSS